MKMRWYLKGWPRARAAAAIWCAVAAGWVAAAPRAAGGEGFRAEIDRRVEQWQPTADERRVDQIAWVPDIRSALRLGNQSGRPIFVFTHDGRLGTGRQ